CILALFSCSIKSVAQTSEKSLHRNARTLINLLDYVSQDYVNAVEDGKIINAGEYSEMLDFTGQAIKLFDSVSHEAKVANKESIAKQLSQVLIFIKQKKDKQLVAFTAQQIKKQILALHLVDLSPQQYPNITEGRKLYSISCQSCHGASGAGDGPLSSSFTPGPLSFLNDSLMQFISPMQVFNTARLGVKGTGMRAFDELSDKQLWEIAFYIKSLPFQNKLSGNTDSLEKLYKQSQARISLPDISQLSDKELQERLANDKTGLALAAIRLHHPSINENNSLTITLSYLDDVLALYKDKKYSDAGQKAVYGYLEGIEPVEQQLMAIDASIVPELENRMNAVRSAIRTNEPLTEVEQKISDAKVSVNKAMVLMNGQTYSFWFSFLIASSILLREGLEAVLIIITILSLLKSLKANDAIKWVHYGWMTAVAIGIASWFLTGWLISFGAQYREAMEAIGSLMAVVILVYVGFWLHNKTEAKKWTQFVELRVTKLLDNKKMIGLAFISFIVVFREAFESVLFLSSLQLQVDEGSKNGIWMGALSAIIVVIVLSKLLLQFSIKIPIQKLFKYSSFIILILAVVLAGQGVHAFQEGGWLSVTSIPINFHSNVLGIYPTLETYAAQVIILLISFSILYLRKLTVAGRKPQMGH
ncbi:MAG: FTR1 family protein, partial [Chitinophagaceae bacterium]